MVKSGGGMQNTVLFFPSFFHFLCFLVRWRRRHAMWHATAATEKEKQKDKKKTRGKKELRAECRRPFL
jgi:hypothetical protein